MKYPILVISDSRLNAFTEKSFGLVSEGGYIFYKKIVIIDCEGVKYKGCLKSAERASFWESINHFQKMYRVVLDIEKECTITVDEFKKLVLELASSDENILYRFSDIEEFRTYLQNQNSFFDIIDMFW
jgi:hypothetical protein